MLLMKDILDEKDKRLREVSKEVQFPLSDEKKKIINDMVEFLTNSQIPELAEKYDLRPGMGLAAIQIGIPERFFVVVNEYDEGQFETYVIINPKIISNSEERIYVENRGRRIWQSKLKKIPNYQNIKVKSDARYISVCSVNTICGREY